MKPKLIFSSADAFRRTVAGTAAHRSRKRPDRLSAERLEGRRLLSAQAINQTIRVYFDNATATGGDLYLTIVDKVSAYQVAPTTGLVSLAPQLTTGFAPSYKITGTVPELPTAGGIPYVTLQATDGSSIVSGRFYVSSAQNAVPMGTTGAPGTISASASFTYDLVEFTLNSSDAPNSLNLDLSQIDQFGLPITVTTTPADADFPNGAGVRPTLSRQEILDQFAAYAAEPAFSAYAGIVQASPSRLLGPNHLINTLTKQAAPNGILEYAGSISGSTPVTGGYEATFTITGTWTTPNQGSKAPLNTSVTTAYQVRGQSLPAGTSVKSVSTSNQEQVTLFSAAPFPDATQVPVSFFVPPSTPLVTTFDQAIHDLFTAFNTPIHIIATPGTIYEGRLRQDFAVPSINDTGSATTNYTVIEFTELGTFSGVTNTITPPATPQKYQIFYPYFTTNSTASPNGNALTPNGVPAPPKWWNPGYYAGRNLDWLTSPSQMVFACNGVFADDVYQNQYFFTEKGDSNWDYRVLGNIENQMSAWLNRGMNPTGNLENRVGFLSDQNLIRVDLTQKKQTKARDLLPDRFQGTGVFYTPARLTTPLPDGSGVVWQTLTGTLKLAGTPIQTFKVLFDAKQNELKLDFTDIGTPANKATSGYLQVHGNGVVKNIYMEMNSATDLSQLTASFDFDYGPATTEAHYGTVSLLSPPSGWTDVVASTTGIEPGMKMIAFSQFSTPMEVYQADAASGTVTIHASTGLQAFNTNVLQFADFYPVDAQGTPVGTWNAYSGFWHAGDRKNGVPAPTIDARSYAFPFDDDGGYSSDINLAWQASTPGQVALVTVRLQPLVGPKIVSGDFNGDGRTDIASRDPTTGLWQVAFTQADPGVSPTTQPMKNWSTATTWSDISVGDFDKDGRDDIVGRAASGAWWWLHYDQSSSSFINTRMGWWSADVAWSNVVVGDFNGDGRADIAGRAPSGMWWMLHDTGGGTFVSTQMNSWSTAVTWSDIVVGNFNGAAGGRESIAGRTSTGTWWMLSYDSASQTFKNTKLAGWATTVDWLEVLAGDFNGDGVDDIAARNSNNSWWLLSYDKGSGSFASSKMGTWSTSATWTNIVSADFDGNGAKDIAGQVKGSGVWWVLGKQGSQFATSNFGGAWPTSTHWQRAFAGLYDSAAVGPPRKSGILGRSSAGSWIRSLSSGSAFTTAAVTGYP